MWLLNDKFRYSFYQPIEMIEKKRKNVNMTVFNHGRRRPFLISLLIKREGKDQRYTDSYNVEGSNHVTKKMTIFKTGGGLNSYK